MKKTIKSVENLASYIDHTCLKPTATKKDIQKLCREAKKYGFASVCVNSCWVEDCKKWLKGSSVKVCTVVDFPLGASTRVGKLAEGVVALVAGADELDLVMNHASLEKPSALKELTSFCKAMKAKFTLCGKEGSETKNMGFSNPNVILKLIIECCYLTKEQKILACKLAKAAGFDFVKTSTGFGTGGATVEDVKLMRRTVGRKMGVKAAGGIRTKEQALAMIAAGATRIGTSHGVEIVK